MKYYIKAFYSDWRQVSEKEYNNFRKEILNGARNIDKCNTEEVEEFLKRHSRKEED